MIPSRRGMRVAVFAGLLLAAVVVCYVRMRTARIGARDAARNLQACEILAEQIRLLQDGPSQAVLRSQSATELSRAIEAAARAANLPADDIVRIDPQAPRRLSDSEYQDQSTGVEIRRVTLQQLILFLDAITRTQAGLRVSAVRLTTPLQDAPAGDPREAWTAEVTLTNLIFAPTS